MGIIARTYDLLVRASGDTRDAQRAMRQLQKSVSNFGRGVRNVGVGMTAALTLPLMLMARTGIEELNAAQQAAAQTNAVLKSTGGVAGVSAFRVSKLATALMEMSGIDDQVIQGGENILLTFTKIGARGGVFDRATKASLDLSVAFGKDMNSSAILVGKALQDPVKGVASLSRVGVSFSKQQKAVIKKLVETGKSAQAQKLILKELETQVGGSARAFGTTAAGAVGRLKEQFAGIAAKMVTMLIPAFTKLAGWLEKGMRWFEGLSAKTQKWVGMGALLLGVLGPVLVAVGSLTVALSAIIPVIVGISAPVWATIGVVAALSVGFLVLYRRSETFRGGVKRIAKFLVNHKKLLAAILFPVLSLAAWMVRLYQRNETFRRGISFIVTAISSYVKSVASIVKKLGEYGTELLYAIQRSATLREGFGLLKDVADLVAAAISLGATATGLFASHALTAAQYIGGKLKPAINGLKTPIGWIRDNAGGAFSALKTVLSAIDTQVSNVVSNVRTLVQLIKDAIGKVESLVKKANKLADIALPGFLGGGGKSGGDKSRSKSMGDAQPAALSMSRGRSGPAVVQHIYPQSQDVESIARRVAFLISSGKVTMKPGIA